MAENAGQGHHTYINHQMYFSKVTVLAVLAASPLVLGSPIIQTRQNGVTCQTSSGSPLTDDVTAVINQLKGRGGNCDQTNDKGSGKSWIPSILPTTKRNTNSL